MAKPLQDIRPGTVEVQKVQTAIELLWNESGYTRDQRPRSQLLVGAMKVGAPSCSLRHGNDCTQYSRQEHSTLYASTIGLDTVAARPFTNGRYIRE